MFNLLTESCPYQNWTSVARERCPNPVNFHCLKDEFGRIGWVCTDPIWVEKDRCPGFNIGAKKLDTTPCFQTKCPPYNYRSNNIDVEYVCRYIMKRESTSSVSMTTMFPASPGTNKTITIIPVFIIIPILVIVVVVVAFLCRRNLKEHKSGRKGEEESGNLLQNITVPPKEIEKQPRSFEEAKEILRLKRTIVITGVQGSGKTFLAKLLVNDLEKNGSILKSTWITNFSQLSQLRKNTEKPLTKENALILDEVFYELQIDKKFKKTLEDLNEISARTKEPYVILTIPSYNWSKNSKEFEAFSGWGHVNLDERHESEKRIILQSLLERYNVPFEQADIICKLESDLLRFTSESIGFPALISWVSKQSREGEVKKALRNPLQSMSDQIASLKSGHMLEEGGKYLILAYMSLKDGKMDINNIDKDMFDKLKKTFVPGFVNKDLKKLVNTMVGYYLLWNEDNGSYEFDLNIIKKIVLVSVAKENSMLVQMNCKNDYLKYVTPTNSCPKDVETFYAECFTTINIKDM